MSEKSTGTQENLQEKSVADETILKIAKEITVKFIEVGRITPSGFDSSFEKIYTTIKRTVRNNRQ